MKKLLLGGLVFVAWAIGPPALAADLPVGPAYESPLIVPIYNWTGFYIGVSGGYSRGDNANIYTMTGFPAFAGSTHLNGGVFGGQGGYNWQANAQWVVGIEADLQGTWENGTDTPPGISTTSCVAGIPLCTTTVNAIGVDQKLRWFGTARARLGFVPWDKVMFYVTGGAAFGEVESNPTITHTTSVTLFGTPFGTPVTQLASGTAINTRGGWTVGGGSEWVLSGPWTGKLEFLFVDLGTVTNTFLGGGAVPTVIGSSRVRDSIVRVGINYRFGEPVVARY